VGYYLTSQKDIVKKHNRSIRKQKRKANKLLIKLGVSNERTTR